MFFAKQHHINPLFNYSKYIIHNKKQNSKQNVAFVCLFLKYCAHKKHKQMCIVLVLCTKMQYNHHFFKYYAPKIWVLCTVLCTSIMCFWNIILGFCFDLFCQLGFFFHFFPRNIFKQLIRNSACILNK